MNPIEEKGEEPKEEEKKEEKENEKELSVKEEKEEKDVKEEKDGNEVKEEKQEKQENEVKEEKEENEEKVEGEVLNLGPEGDNSSENKNKEKEEGEKKEGEGENEEGKEEEKKRGEEGEGNKEDLNSVQQKETFKSISGEGEDEMKRGSVFKGSQNLGSKINEEKTREKTFENVKLIYNYQLNQIGKLDNFEQIYDKFWKLLPQTFEGEISKSSFLLLITKIAKILLPLFNYSQINKFCEGIWFKHTKGKNSMSKEIFNKIIFKITHLLSVNVNQYEYEDTLNLIYNRITCIRKYYANGEEKIFYPSIKVTLLNSLSKEEYQNGTWEVFENANTVNLQLFEQFDSENNETEEKNAEGKNNEENKDKEAKNLNSEGDEEKEKICKVRPKLKIINDFVEDNKNKETLNTNPNNKDDKTVQNIKTESYYDLDRNIFLYNEDTFYEDQEEIDKYSQELNCHIKYELMEDNELIIYGYPTQFVLNKFLNNMKELQDINISPDSEYDSTFYITDYQPYEKRKIYLKILDKEKLISFL